MPQNTYYMGVGKYFQGEYALNRIGQEASQLGRRALIIGGERALGAALPRIEESLQKADIPYSVEGFHGFCTEKQMRYYQEKLESREADIVIGVGGGKAIDTAKGVSVFSGARLINVPTNIAQCACYANIIIMYEEDGRTCGVMDLNKPIDVVIADSDILARHSPVRLMAAGIGDSMAKRPEIEFSLKYDPEPPTMLAQVSYGLAEKTWALYEKYGRQACEDAENGLVTKAVEDIICANIVLTGICSSLVNGEKQIAVAHNTYNGMCGVFKEQQKNYLHGEMVSMALPVQMALNGAETKTIRSLIDFLGGLGVPMKPSEMDLEPSEENFNYLIKYIAEHVPQMTENLQESLLNCMREWWR